MESVCELLTRAVEDCQMTPTMRLMRQLSEFNPKVPNEARWVGWSVRPGHARSWRTGARTGGLLYSVWNGRRPAGGAPVRLTAAARARPRDAQQVAEIEQMMEQAFARDVAFSDFREDVEFFLKASVWRQLALFPLAAWKQCYEADETEPARAVRGRCGCD